MASGTVGYTDTRGNKDYLGIVAQQVKRRLKKHPTWQGLNVPMQKALLKKITRL